jgi:hypothetical protein
MISGPARRSYAKTGWGREMSDDIVKVFCVFAVPFAICADLGWHQDLFALVADAFCIGVVGLVALWLILVFVRTWKRKREPTERQGGSPPVAERVP